MTVGIGIPVTETAPTKFMGCLLKLVERLNRKDIPYLYYMTTIRPIDRARNEIVNKLKDKVDEILFIDSDMIFDPDLYERLHEANKDIVSGLYFQKYRPYAPVAYDFKNGKFRPIDINKIDSALVKVDGFGMGACLIKSYVFHELDMPYFEHSAKYSEDLFFCAKARKKFELWLNAALILDHWGGVIGIETCLAEQKLLR